jgi:hypothetical protein
MRLKWPGSTAAMEEYYEAVKKARALRKTKSGRAPRTTSPSDYADDAELSASQAVAFLGCTYPELMRLRISGAITSVSDRRGGYRYVAQSLKALKNLQPPKAA